MTDDLVKRHVEQLRLTGGDLADLCQPLADAIEALTAERDEALECNEEFFVDNQFLKKRAEKAGAERDRLREALEQFLIEYDEVDLADAEPSSMVSAVLAARAALKGETP